MMVVIRNKANISGPIIGRQNLKKAKDSSLNASDLIRIDLTSKCFSLQSQEVIKCKNDVFWLYDFCL